MTYPPSAPAPSSLPQPVPPPAAPPRTTSIIAWVALGLGILGLILAFLPVASFFAWPFTLAAFILAIIGLVQKGRTKLVPGISLGLSIVGFIVAVVVSIVSLVAASANSPGNAGQTRPAAPNSSTEPAEEEEPPADALAQPSEATVGQTVTSRDGISFTVNAVNCGMSSYGDSFLTETASGQFCEIRFTVVNGSDKTLDLFAGDVTGLIGQAEYEPEATLAGFGDDGFYSKLNPGLTTEGIAVIDIPAGAKLDYVQLQTSWIFGEPLLIRVP